MYNSTEITLVTKTLIMITYMNLSLKFILDIMNTTKNSMFKLILDPYLIRLKEKELLLEEI